MYCDVPVPILCLCMLSYTVEFIAGLGDSPAGEGMA
jgi:hypothetical protein